MFARIAGLRPPAAGFQPDPREFLVRRPYQTIAAAQLAALQ